MKKIIFIILIILIILININKTGNQNESNVQSISFDKWSSANDFIRTSEDILTIVNENDEKSLNVELTNLNLGIEQELESPIIQKIEIPIYINEGSVTAHIAKKDGTSAFFNCSKFQNNFLLKDGILSTAIRDIHGIKLDNGDYMELFSATNSSETSGLGGIYSKRNGGDPILFRDDLDFKNWVYGQFLDYSNKYTWINLRVNKKIEGYIYATDIDRNFENQGNDRLILGEPGYNFQTYNAIITSNGETIIPYVYAKSTDIYTGPWYLDVLISDDDLVTYRKLNQPKTVSGRGIIEPQVVELSNEKVAILFRTELGRIGRADLDLETEILGEPFLTNFEIPSAGFYVKKLNDGSIAIAWISGKAKEPGSNFPRKYINLAFSEDDLQTWNNLHIIATSDAINGDMVNDTPFLNQPVIVEDGDKLTVYFEEVIDSSNINSYKTESINYKPHKKSVTTVESGLDILDVELCSNAKNIQLIGAIEAINEFSINDVTVEYFSDRE